MVSVTHRGLAIIVAVALVLGAGFGWGGLAAMEPARPAAAVNPPAAVKAALPVPSGSFIRIVEAVGPAVININTVTRGIAGRTPIEEFFGEEFMRRLFGDRPERELPQRGLGSGVIVDPSGVALTNAHVVEGATEIEVVTADGKKPKAKVVGVDRKTDLAVLRLEGPGPFPAVTLGDSSQMQVGDWVLAIGSPFGLHQTVSAGIISGKSRVIGQGRYDDFLQTDAAINPGNSGGPLVNMSGEVIGINTAILSRTGGSIGIGFAIPSGVAQHVYRELLAKGKVTRGWLGVTIQPLTPELAKGFGLQEPTGALIAEVINDSPAEKAGLRPGDIILEFDRKKVGHTRELQRAVTRADPGKTAPMTVWRDKAEKSLTVRLGEMPEDRIAAGVERAVPKMMLGMEVRPLTPDLAWQLDVRSDTGVVVVSVHPDGPSARAGVRSGDVILEVNHERIRALGDFERVVKGVEPGEHVTLLLQRGRQNLYVAFEVGRLTGYRPDRRLGAAGTSQRRRLQLVTRTSHGERGSGSLCVRGRFSSWSSSSRWGSSLH
jgi:serine protease Do